MKTSYVEGPPPWVQLPRGTPLGHLLDTSYGIHFGSTPPWRFWDTMQQIQQIHKLRLAVSLLFVCLTCSQRLPHERDLVNHPSNSPMPMKKDLLHSA